MRYLVTLFSLLFASSVSAVTINFGCITANDSSGTSCAIAESQLTLNIEIFDPPGSSSFENSDDDDDHHESSSFELEGSSDEYALFTFSNSGPTDSFIADIYFMFGDDEFLSFESFLNGPGVDFEEGARPGTRGWWYW
jgi:hypothetical protein